MRELQNKIGKWHRRKFGHDCPLGNIGNKLGEEAGEVCRALDRLIYAKTWAAENDADENLEQELGDTLIVLMAIADRRSIDLERAAWNRAAAKGMLE